MCRCPCRVDIIQQNHALPSDCVSSYMKGILQIFCPLSGIQILLTICMTTADQSVSIHRQIQIAPDPFCHKLGLVISPLQSATPMDRHRHNHLRFQRQQLLSVSAHQLQRKEIRIFSPVFLLHCQKRTLYLLIGKDTESTVKCPLPLPAVKAILLRLRRNRLSAFHASRSRYVRQLFLTIRAAKHTVFVDHPLTQRTDPWIKQSYHSLFPECSAQISFSTSQIASFSPE